MIYALKNWNNPNTYYTQENNPQETILKKEDGKGYLEFCGATAAVSLLAARGDDVKINCPGDWEPQPEAILGNFFHDERNYAMFLKIRSGINPETYFNNRIPQFYPYAIKRIFDVNATFEWGTTRNLKELLQNNVGVMLCFIDPGHFIGVVAIDTDKNMLCYNDPWKKNYYPKHLQGMGGFNRWIKLTEIKNNLMNFRILVGA